MGTKIDEYKKHLLDIMDSMPDDACGDWRDSLAYAIETMRKYQKIQEIVKSWEGDTWTNGISEDCMEKISEVMEGGNDD